MTEVISRWLEARVFHARQGAVRHRFALRTHLVAVELAEWETGKLPVSRQGRRGWSLHDDDYLQHSSQPPVVDLSRPQTALHTAGPDETDAHSGLNDGSLRQKLEQQLTRVQVEPPTRVTLITAPRFWGYVFNPVSFFFCYDADDRISAVIAEVNNTFTEKHLYVQPFGHGQRPLRGERLRFSAPKTFHVSPFYRVDGDYDFLVQDAGDFVDLRVVRRCGETIEFIAQLRARAQPLTRAAQRQTLWRRPWGPWATMPRILGHAAWLSFVKRVPAYRRPAPRNSMTIRSAKTSRWQRFCQRMVLSHLQRITHGHLSVILPDGEVRSFGHASSYPTATMRVRDVRFFTQLLTHGNVGLGEAFTNGDWESPDVTAVLELFLANERQLHDRSSWWTRLGLGRNRKIHRRRANVVGQSQENIQQHYDLSNELYQTFLDESMTYSCAIFESPSQSLEDAQRNKIRRILDKACLQPGQHVLEIGCGWGALAIEAARNYGCRVTGLTLSQAQLTLAQERVEQAGLSHLINLQLCDYRQVSGKYDRIISVEMLEAVGHEFYGTYFRRLDELLAPGGVVVLQSITIADQRYETYRRGCDWIQKHIFPGGHLPSVTAVCQAATQSSHLFLEHLENYGVHYAETLRRWREAFRNHLERVKSIGFDDEFIRKWDYYFSYCEAGFNARALGDVQFVFTRVNNHALPGLEGVPFSPDKNTAATVVPQQADAR